MNDLRATKKRQLISTSSGFTGIINPISHIVLAEWKCNTPETVAQSGCSCLVGHEQDALILIPLDASLGTWEGKSAPTPVFTLVYSWPRNAARTLLSLKVLRKCLWTTELLRNAQNKALLERDAQLMWDQSNLHSVQWTRFCLQRATCRRFVLLLLCPGMMFWLTASRNKQPFNDLWLDTWKEEIRPNKW